jgi:hypothetical protein
MTKSRKRVLAAITVMGSFALWLGLAEVVLRFLPVATGIRSSAESSANSVFRFVPNRDFVFSKRWDMIMANRGHVNNAGFVNERDYRKDDPTPLIAVIGDSFIEAAMVPFRETLHGRVAAKLAGDFRVYSFGASAAPLSQYLIWARHAMQEYGPRGLVINIVGNDFDESLARYRIVPGYWHYVSTPGGELQLQYFEWERGPNPIVNLMLGSALGCYLIFNLNVLNHWDKMAKLLSGRATAAGPYAGNTAADANAERVRNSFAAVDAFLRDLSGLGLPSDRVLFTMDGFRYPERAADGAGTYFDVMRRAFRAKAEALGYEVIDLDPAFFTRHARAGEKFEYPHDGHWNPTGHEVAFEAVMGSRLIKTLLH